MKTCSKCGKEKQDHEFRKGKGFCRICENEYQRNYSRKRRAENPEKENAKKRAYYHANKATVRAIQVKYEEKRKRELQFKNQYEINKLEINLEETNNG